MTSKVVKLEEDIDGSRWLGNWLKCSELVSKYKRKYYPQGSGKLKEKRKQSYLKKFLIIFLFIPKSHFLIPSKKLIFLIVSIK